ncbi:syntaxin-7-like [Centruroides sculpturatus]|uniref:syntaxin-7-like n=1 Tax=Centruroides sculpturatus TaxID=218467 RepID=UPI000C6E38CF|nr:syntaxin-7-like [Centruroides sculpturatus]
MAKSFGYDGYQYSSYKTGYTSESQNEFSRLSQEIGTNIQKISQNVASMQKMVSQLGTPQDSETLRSQLHQVQHYTNQLAKDTSSLLKNLSHLSSASDQKDVKMLKDRLTDEFTECLKNFQETQRTAAHKERESVMRARASSGLTGNPFDDGSSKNAVNLIDLASPTQLQMEEDVNIELLREREMAVRKLEADIVDVNQIFKDLASLVHDQGEIIDSIEVNVENAAEHVTGGTKQLAQAREHQSKARRKKCCLLVFGVIVLAILITIIVIYTKD